MVSHYVGRNRTRGELEGLIPSQKALYYILLLLIKSYATPIFIMTQAFTYAPLCILCIVYRENLFRSRSSNTQMLVLFVFVITPADRYAP